MSSMPWEDPTFLEPFSCLKGKSGRWHISRGKFPMGDLELHFMSQTLCQHSFCIVSKKKWLQIDADVTSENIQFQKFNHANETNTNVLHNSVNFFFLFRRSYCVIFIKK